MIRAMGGKIKEPIMSRDVLNIIASVLGILDDETVLLGHGIAANAPNELRALAREHGAEDHLNVALLTTRHDQTKNKHANIAPRNN